MSTITVYMSSIEPQVTKYLGYDGNIGNIKEDNYTYTIPLTTNNKRAELIVNTNIIGESDDYVKSIWDKNNGNLSWERTVDIVGQEIVIIKDENGLDKIEYKNVEAFRPAITIKYTHPAVKYLPHPYWKSTVVDAKNPDKIIPHSPFIIGHFISDYEVNSDETIESLASYYLSEINSLGISNITEEDSFDNLLDLRKILDEAIIKIPLSKSDISNISSNSLKSKLQSFVDDIEDNIIGILNTIKSLCIKLIDILDGNTDIWLKKALNETSSHYEAQPIVRPGEYIQLTWNMYVNGVQKSSVIDMVPYETPLFTGGKLISKQGEGVDITYTAEIFGEMISGIVPTDFFEYELGKWAYFIKDVSLTGEHQKFSNSNVGLPNNNYRLTPFNFKGPMSNDMAINYRNDLEIDSASNFEKVFDMIRYESKIKEVDYKNDKAKVDIGGVEFELPIFYHCTEDPIIEGGSKAFSVDDDVIIEKPKDDEGYDNAMIIGLSDKINKCFSKEVLLVKQKYSYNEFGVPLYKYVIWDVDEDKPYEIKDSNGNTISYPCIIDDIEEWLEFAKLTSGEDDDLSLYSQKHQLISPDYGGADFSFVNSNADEISIIDDCPDTNGNYSLIKHKIYVYSSTFENNIFIQNVESGWDIGAINVLNYGRSYEITTNTAFGAESFLTSSHIKYYSHSSLENVHNYNDYTASYVSNTSEKKSIKYTPLGAFEELSGSGTTYWNPTEGHTFTSTQINDATSALADRSSFQSGTWGENVIAMCFQDIRTLSHKEGTGVEGSPQESSTTTIIKQISDVMIAFKRYDDISEFQLSDMSRNTNLEAYCKELLWPDGEFTVYTEGLKLETYLT